LSPLDECPCLRVLNASDLPEAAPSVFAFEGLGFVEDREFGLIRRIRARQLPSKVIERRAEVVETVSDHERPFGCSQGLVDEGSSDVLSCLAVLLKDNSVGVRLTEPLDALVQGVQVFVCPTELCFEPV
jgi:hypothetical protein